jgi:hypothetical protein
MAEDRLLGKGGAQGVHVKTEGKLLGKGSAKGCR